MATWFVTDDQEYVLATVESLEDGRVRVAVHAIQPFTVNHAEQLRSVIGAAIGDAQGQPS